MSIEAVFEGATEPTKKPEASTAQAAVFDKKSESQRTSTSQARTTEQAQSGGTRTKPLDVSDASTWKTTNEVLKHFPGTVTEIVDGGTS